MQNCNLSVYESFDWFQVSFLQVQDSSGGETGLRRVCWQEPSQAPGHHHHRRSENKHTCTSLCHHEGSVRLILHCSGDSSHVRLVHKKDLFPLPRQHRVPERQHSRQSLKNFPLCLHLTTRQPLFVFSCLYRSKVWLRTWTPPSEGADLPKRTGTEYAASLWSCLTAASPAELEASWKAEVPPLRCTNTLTYGFHHGTCYNNCYKHTVKPFFVCTQVFCRIMLETRV